MAIYRINIPDVPEIELMYTVVQKTVTFLSATASYAKRAYAIARAAVIG